MDKKRSATVALLLVAALGLGLGIRRGVGDELERGSSPAAEGTGDRVPAPEFTGVTQWINSEPLTLADQKGKVVVVHFWTNGCINCIHNYPRYRAWQARYKKEPRFLMVGVHTPELEPEKSVERIEQQMAKNKLMFPVAVDNDGANWKAWSNRYWPSVYVVDKTGAVRFRWEGELGDEGYKRVTGVIDELLAQTVAAGK